MAEPTKRLSKGAWRAMDASTKLAAAALAPKVSKLAYRVITGKVAPKNARHPDLATKEALVAAGIGGAVVEIVRTAVRRQATTYWVKSTGELPPGMKSLD